MLKEMVLLTKWFFRVLKVVLLWHFWVQKNPFESFICKTTLAAVFGMHTVYSMQFSFLQK